VTLVQIRESRPKVTLVARMAASVANYDYIMDWEFQMDGLIRIKVRIRYIYASDHQLSSHFSHEKMISARSQGMRIWLQHTRARESTRARVDLGHKNLKTRIS
jgi:hypothetical protein